MMSLLDRFTKLTSFIVVFSVSLSLAGCGSGGGTGGARSSGKTFAYILDDSGLQVFQVDNNSGALSEVDNPVRGAGSNPPPHTSGESITLDPLGHYAYMAHGSSKPEISLYSVDATGGFLTALPDVYQWYRDCGGCLEDMSSVNVDPTGHLLFATDTGPDNQRVYSFRISDGSNANEREGQITSIYGNDFVSSPCKVVFHPHGDLIFVLGNGGSSVGVATVNTDPQDANYGYITAIKNSPFDLGSSNTGSLNWPNDLAVRPDGQFLYVATSDGSTDNRIFIYAIAQSTTATEEKGNLTLVRYFSTPGSVKALAIDPEGQFLFGVDSSNNQILPWTINASTGDLTAVDHLPGTPSVHDGYVTAANPLTLAIDPFGKFLYVGAADGTFVHTIDRSTGAVTEFDAATDVPFGSTYAGQIVIRYISEN